jgi:hypothetical protein
MSNQIPTRYAPKGSTRVTIKDLPGVEIYLYEAPSRVDGIPLYGAIAYQGKRSKPDFHYTWGAAGQKDAFQRREAHIREWLDVIQERRDRKAKEKAEREEWTHDLKVGEILYGSWGYDQTNVEYFEVVEVRGKSVIIRELEQTSISDGTAHSMSDYRMPKPGCYQGAPMRKIPQKGWKGEVGVRVGHAYCTRWDGKKKYNSWYG